MMVKTPLPSMRLFWSLREQQYSLAKDGLGLISFEMFYDRNTSPSTQKQQAGAFIAGAFDVKPPKSTASSRL